MLVSDVKNLMVHRVILMPFFHKVASGQRCSSHISLAMLSLPNDSSEDSLHIVVSESFTEKFSGEGYLHVASWDVEFSSLEGVCVGSLEFPFSEDEIF